MEYEHKNSLCHSGGSCDTGSNRIVNYEHPYDSAWSRILVPTKWNDKIDLRTSSKILKIRIMIKAISNHGQTHSKIENPVEDYNIYR